MSWYTDALFCSEVDLTLHYLITVNAIHLGYMVKTVCTTHSFHIQFLPLFRNVLPSAASHLPKCILLALIGEDRPDETHIKTFDIESFVEQHSNFREIKCLLCVNQTYIFSMFGSESCLVSQAELY